VPRSSANHALRSTSRLVADGVCVCPSPCARDSNNDRFWLMIDSTMTTFLSNLRLMWRALRNGSLEFAYADLWRYSFYVMCRPNFAVRRADFTDASHVNFGQWVLVWRKRPRA
jgi:hypothetical protein